MKKIKILIVEDDVTFSLSLRSIIEKMGHEVIKEIDNGEDAIEECLDLDPDLILMDIVLAGEISGIDAAEKIHQKKNIPIIYLSSYSDKKTLDKVKLTEPAGFLIKPVHQDNLQTALEVDFYSHFKKLAQIEQINTDKIQLENENKQQKLALEELNQTTQHLASATFREREQKQKLQETLDELEVAKQLIEIQNLKIKDSINYAERIQQSILKGHSEVYDFLKDGFILYKPKDVVSGDFPWFYKINDIIYLAAVDCTGHGVPGAMMSLIGYMSLNEIVERSHHPKPSEILDQLHTKVSKLLGQDCGDTISADGMDIAICRIDLKSNELQFAGAGRPLYYLKGTEVIPYKGDKWSIGGKPVKNRIREDYTNHVIKTAANDAILIFSDGFQDQFGGEENFKFGPKRIRETFSKNSNLSMEQLKEVFDDELSKWKSETKQTDDILMIGLRF